MCTSAAGELLRSGTVDDETGAEVLAASGLVVVGASVVVERVVVGASVVVLVESIVVDGDSVDDVVVERAVVDASVVVLVVVDVVVDVVLVVEVACASETTGFRVRWHS